MAMLKAQNVDISYYGSSFSVKNFNMSLRSGESAVLYGREGCGKTTVLRMLAKLEEFQSGEIYVDEKSLRDYSQKDLNFGYTFDSSVLQKNDNVSDVISYPMRLREFSQETVDDYLSKVAKYGLPMESKVCKLTQVQIAILIIARLFSVERRLYLVDDVWKDLPKDQQLQVVELLRSLVDGKSALIATDDVEIFKSLGINSVVVLSRGFANPQLSYQELVMRPPDMESAIFCGYELHIGLLEKQDGEYFAVTQDNRFSIDRPISDVYVGKKVCFALKEDASNQACSKLVIARDLYYDLQSEKIISSTKKACDKI